MLWLDDLFTGRGCPAFFAHDDPVDDVHDYACSAQDGSDVNRCRVIVGWIDNRIADKLGYKFGKACNAECNANDNGNLFVPKPAGEDAFLHSHNHTATETIYDLACDHDRVTGLHAAYGDKQASNKDDDANACSASYGTQTWEVIDEYACKERKNSVDKGYGRY